MMMVKEAAQVLHTGWSGEDVLFNGVSTDSRTLKRGDLFAASDSNYRQRKTAPPVRS